METPGNSSFNTASIRNKLLWLIFVFAGTLVYMLGYHFPSAIFVKTKFPFACPKEIFDKVGYECGDVGKNNNPVVAVELDKLDTSNKFLLLEAFPIFQNLVRNKKVKVEFEVSCWAFNDPNITPVACGVKEQKTIEYSCSGKFDKACPPQTIGQVLEINSSFNHFIFLVKILNTGEIIHEGVDDMRFAFVTFNPVFGYWIQNLKWGAFLVAITSFVLYFILLRQTESTASSDSLGINDYILALSFALILFTQPFINTSTLGNTFAIINIIGNSLQNALITLLWLSLIEKLTSSDGSIPALTHISIICLSVIHFIVLGVIYKALDTNQTKDPLTTFETDPDFIISVGRYYTYLFYLLTGIWSIRKLVSIIPRFNELGWRNNTLLTFTFCYFTCYLFFLHTGSFQTFNLKESRASLLYGLTILYTILLQVISVPLKEGTEEISLDASFESKQKTKYGKLNEENSATLEEHGDVKLKAQDELKSRDLELEDYGQRIQES